MVQYLWYSIGGKVSVVQYWWYNIGGTVLWYSIGGTILVVQYRWYSIVSQWTRTTKSALLVENNSYTVYPVTQSLCRRWLHLPR